MKLHETSSSRNRVDGLTDKQEGRQTDRQGGWQAHIHTNRETEGQI